MLITLVNKLKLNLKIKERMRYYTKDVIFQQWNICSIRVKMKGNIYNEFKQRYDYKMGGWILGLHSEVPQE